MKNSPPTPLHPAKTPENIPAVEEKNGRKHICVDENE
jgi:hypothetical protein